MPSDPVADVRSRIINRAGARERDPARGISGGGFAADLAGQQLRGHEARRSARVSRARCSGKGRAGTAPCRGNVCLAGMAAQCGRSRCRKACLSGTGPDQRQVVRAGAAIGLPCRPAQPGVGSRCARASRQAGTAAGETWPGYSGGDPLGRGFWIGIVRGRRWRRYSGLPRWAGAI